ncbi:unnamed protein product [Fusarium venenatum]|uniref:Uncharacterized protein n=1 Tax=Fusarium venenatum TaxID=56646 RepID=A0A2L2TFW1_9HYPO|nr:uncharacterized protein FVRRES_09055 [Fusarium venenatum]CEI68978.1 unnamed protein product [Fusarium venenatum]
MSPTRKVPQVKDPEAGSVIIVSWSLAASRLGSHFDELLRISVELELPISCPTKFTTLNLDIITSYLIQLS